MTGMSSELTKEEFHELISTHMLDLNTKRLELAYCAIAAMLWSPASDQYAQAKLQEIEDFFLADATMDTMDK